MLLNFKRHFSLKMHGSMFQMILSLKLHGGIFQTTYYKFFETTWWHVSNDPSLKFQDGMFQTSLFSKLYANVVAKLEYTGGDSIYTDGCV